MSDETKEGADEAIEDPPTVEDMPASGPPEEPGMTPEDRVAGCDAAIKQALQMYGCQLVAELAPLRVGSDGPVSKVLIESVSRIYPIE